MQHRTCCKQTLFYLCLCIKITSVYSTDNVSGRNLRKGRYYAWYYWRHSEVKHMVMLLSLAKYIQRLIHRLSYTLYLIHVFSVQLCYAAVGRNTVCKIMSYI